MYGPVKNGNKTDYNTFCAPVHVATMWRWPLKEKKGQLTDHLPCYSYTMVLLTEMHVCACIEFFGTDYVHVY